MDKFTDEDYQPLIDWIKRARKNNRAWDEIRDKSKNSDFFERQIEDDFWPEDSQAVWGEFVDKMVDIETQQQRTMEDARRGTIYGPQERNALKPSEIPNSLWQSYRRHLLNEARFDTNSVMRLECECGIVLSMLNNNTAKGNSVRGLVVGNIQSGKTSNMEGLISMTLDSGWNMAIVLSGMYTNLDEQTGKRLHDDLTFGECNLNLKWLTIGNGKTRMKMDCVPVRPQDLQLGAYSSDRYVVTTLKSPARLKKLLHWLNEAPGTKRNLRILLIDDEADYGSVNGVNLNSETRRTVNKLVVRLVECQDENGEYKGDYGCMDYVAYTATPYANFLSDSTPEGLYPRNFVELMTPSTQYIGPKQIFGYPPDGMGGMDIVRDVPDGDLARIKKGEISPSLRDSICWFVCALCAMRRSGYRRPVSMLVHTSLERAAHQKVAQAIRDLLIDDGQREALLENCRRVYERESKYTLGDFENDCPAYDIKRREALEYPSFEILEDDIRALLSESHGMPYYANDAGGEKFRPGINICIDDSSGSVIDCDDDYDAYHPRLVYPPGEPGDDGYPPSAPAFIVVAGNTMSRGMTLLGLVSTYFTRQVNTGDTLMQMGRWFGFRQGYELCQRIWMPKRVRDAFTELTSVDEELREFIRNNYRALTPEEYPAMVRKFPAGLMVKTVTSRNKMYASKEAGYDFQGTLTEVTVIDKDPDSISRNEARAMNFLESLRDGKGMHLRDPLSKSASVWIEVATEDVLAFLMGFEYSERTSLRIDALNDWLSKNLGDDTKWHVILAGTSDVDRWGPEGFKVGTVGRTSRPTQDETSYHLSSTSSPADRFADVSESYVNSMPLADRDRLEAMIARESSKEWMNVRNLGGAGRNPALIIYPIRGGKKTRATGREVIDYDGILIAPSIIIPGDKLVRNLSRYVQADIDKGGD